MLFISTGIFADKLRSQILAVATTANSPVSHAIGLAYQVNENIVISGDLNSDLMSLNNYKLIDTMRLFSLKYVIEKPTRVNIIRSHYSK